MFTLALVFTVVLLLLGDVFIKRRKLPPGPFPIPILGSMPYLAWKTYKHGSIVNAMLQLKKDYGKVFTVWFGPIPTVSIADYEIAHESMVKHGNEFANRWTPFILKVAADANLGIVFSNGTNWLEQRRFALHTLRNFGLGRNIMEQRVMDEYHFRTDLLDKQLKTSSSIEAHRFFDITVGSVIQRLLVSKRYGKDDEAEFFERKGKLDKVIEMSSFLDVCAPDWVLKVPLINKRFEKITRVQFEIRDYFKSLIQERQDSITCGEHILEGEGQDYVDAFLIEMQKNNDRGEYTTENLTHNLVDLWIAGQETTSTTLQWAGLVLLSHREVMEKVRAEVASITGSKRTLSLQDKKNTPYLNATINEIQRFTSIMSFNLWRETTVDTTVGGYSVPKGTVIAAQMSLIMRDEQHFKNSEHFDPSRFLNTSIEQYMIPFGIGKRVCLGESLARAELYLILGNLLHDYELTPVGGVPPEIKPVSTHEAVMRRPVHYSMNLKKRVF